MHRSSLHRFCLLLFIVLLATAPPSSGVLLFAADHAEGADARDDLARHGQRRRIDEIFAAIAPDDPGCAVSITCDGELLLKNAYGSANLDYGIPITSETRFSVASLSKQVTAAALLLLDQDGEVDLDDDVRAYLPELPEYRAPITLRHLLHHTSGLRDIIHLLQIEGRGLDRVTGRDRLLSYVFAQHDLNFRPGSAYLYSNTGYVLIAEVIERVTGERLNDYAARNFFEPSKMEHTHFHADPARPIPNRAMSYIRLGTRFGEFYRGHADWIGARGLVTSVEDFALWSRNFTDNRTPLDDFAERMTERGSTDTGWQLRYASGLYAGTYRGIETFAHDGNYMGFRTQFLYLPDEEIAISVFCNRADVSPYSYAVRIVDELLADRFEEELKRYEGEYEHDSLRARYTVTLRDGDLYLEHDRRPAQRFVHRGQGEFASGSRRLEFADGADYFTLRTPSVGELTFRRRGDPLPDDEPSDDGL